MRVFEINEIGDEMQEHDEPIANTGAFVIKRSWQIGENTRIFEFRSDRNHLSVEIHGINEDASRENALSLQQSLLTAYTILSHPEGGNY